MKKSLFRQKRPLWAYFSFQRPVPVHTGSLWTVMNRVSDSAGSGSHRFRLPVPVQVLVFPARCVQPSISAVPHLSYFSKNVHVLISNIFDTETLDKLCDWRCHPFPPETKTNRTTIWQETPEPELEPVTGILIFYIFKKSLKYKVVPLYFSKS